MSASTIVQTTAATLSYENSATGHVVTVTTLGYAFSALDEWLLGLFHIPAPPGFVFAVLGSVAATLIIRRLAL